MIKVKQNFVIYNSLLNAEISLPCEDFTDDQLKEITSLDCFVRFENIPVFDEDDYIFTVPDLKSRKIWDNIKEL